MRKLFLLVFLISTFQSCIQPSVYSIVDSSLFSDSYKKPYFVIVYSGDFEREIAEDLVEKIKNTFKAHTALMPNFQIISRNSIGTNDLNSFVQNPYESKGSDLLFKINIEHISLYGDIIQNFKFIVTAYDYKIDKEVFKAKIFTPTYGDSVLKMCVQFVEKLKNDKVL